MNAIVRNMHCLAYLTFFFLSIRGKVDIMSRKGMAAAQNRRRKRKKGGADDRSLWGFLFRKDEPNPNFLSGAFYSDEEEGAEDEGGQARSLMREVLSRINVLTCVAVAVFLLFTGSLIVMVCRMWSPQSLNDVAGYQDQGNSRDLSVMLKNANGAEVSFTEGELNRYLRDTCRMRQTGLFSLIAHVQGVAVRCQDGYVEIVVDRIIGANMHQTTAVNLTFRQETDHGRPVLKIDFHGGEPLYGSMPRGGKIGRVGVPQRHMEMLKPALETLLDCYPEIVSLVEEYGYCPHFTEGKDGVEGRVRLLPYTPEI